jgi:hypothetical protein
MRSTARERDIPSRGAKYVGIFEPFLDGFELPSLLLSKWESKSLKEAIACHRHAGAVIEQCALELARRASLKRIYLVQRQKSAGGLFVLEI